MPIPDKYIFNALVDDINQPLKLLAYAIYKADKNEIAKSLDSSGMEPDDIEQELQRFHDLVLNSSGLLNNYHTRANALGENLVASIKKKVGKDAKNDFVDRVNQVAMTDKSLPYHIGAWFLDAIKGLFATILVIIIFGGCYSLFLTKEERSNLYSAAGQSLLDTVSGELPVIDKYKELKALKEQQAKEQAAKNKQD